MNNIRYGFVLRRSATILSVAVFTLTLTAAITGILLAFYYQPTAGGAYNSLKHIDTQVANGWLIRSIHDIAGNWVIGISLIQLVVLFLGERLRRSWFTAWISGILLALTGIGLSWTAIILDWTQIGYWRFRIELGSIEAVPLIGSTLRYILTGGGNIDTLTVAHLYTLHSYILAIAALMLSVVHLTSLLWQEQEEKRNAIAAEATAADSELSPSA